MPNEIELREVENTDTIQHAELRIPLAKLGLTSTQVFEALAIVDRIREAALAHVGVDEDNADATDIDYELDGDTVIVNVIQVCD